MLWAEATNVFTIERSLSCAGFLTLLSLRVGTGASRDDGRAADQSAQYATEEFEGWTALEPGQGFQLANTERGDLWISAYALFRYLNFGDQDAGYSTSDERIVGVNYFPLDTRNVRVNAQLIDVDGSPVNSVFGYYVGGQRGQTFSMDSPYSFEAPEALMRPRTQVYGSS